MKIHVIGGGPAGLYFASLMKKAWPQTRITVFERNRPDDTFGFGVVFSDETLSNFETCDLESYRAIVGHFAYWDDIEIHFRGATHRIGGNGFCGCARSTLLKILSRRARSLGVEIVYQAEISPLDPAILDADLVVAADGINSRLREAFAATFKPTIDLRPNFFSWMGSTRPFDAFTFFFRETEHGIFIAHCYQYEPQCSTWIIETDPQTFARAGPRQARRSCLGAFCRRPVREGARRPSHHHQSFDLAQFPDYPLRALGCRQCGPDRRREGHRAFLHRLRHQARHGGRALHCYDAFRATGGHDAGAALAAFRGARRDEVEKTQHSADVSLVWFEHVNRFWNMDPTRFAFGLMTRSKAITYDNLALRAPEFVKEADRVVARDVAFAGLLRRHRSNPVAPMFQPLPPARHDAGKSRRRLADVPVFVAQDGMPSDWHLVHYGSRAVGGAGLMFTEMTDCPALGADLAGLCRHVQRCARGRVETDRRFRACPVRARNSACSSAMPAAKGATKLMWEGIDEPLEQGAWPIISASPLPYFPHSAVPREMTRADMDAVIAEFVAAAKRADRAGFDMLEMHAAHGYLLASFISPLTNRRSDEYGGVTRKPHAFSARGFSRHARRHGRMRSRCRCASPRPTGPTAGSPAMTRSRLRARSRRPAATLSMCLQARRLPMHSPIFGRMYQTPFSDQIRNEAGLATMCVGAITTADQVNTILAAGRADLVALARPASGRPLFHHESGRLV